MFLRPDKLNIISIDPSFRSTGICYCLNGKITTQSIKRKEERLELLGWYLRFFNNIAKETKFDLVIIEMYAFSQGHSDAATKQSELGGIIRACFSARKIPILEIPIGTWKAISGLNQWQKNHNVKLKKLTKHDQALYQEACFDLLGMSADSCDEIDALYFLYTAIQCSKGLVKKGAGDNIRSFLEKNKILLENK